MKKATFCATAPRPKENVPKIEVKAFLSRNID